MARISGVDIPRDKRVEISLTYIYGIGLTTSRKILERTRVDPDTRVKNLTEEEVNRLREVIDREYGAVAGEEARADGRFQLAERRSRDDADDRGNCGGHYGG